MYIDSSRNRSSHQYIPTRRYVLCLIYPPCQGLSLAICRLSACASFLTTTAPLPSQTRRSLISHAIQITLRPTIYSMMDPHQLTRGASRGDQTRGRLLKAAKALFLLGGPAAVTVDDICLAAGVSKGGFYHHFPDKESAFLVVASGELTREMELLAHSASNTAAERGGSTLLVDLWAWTPRHPQARRWVRAAHRQALRRLSNVPGQAARGPASTGDRQAQAAFALLVGIGRVVQRVTARYPTTGELGRRKAAAS